MMLPNETQESAIAALALALKVKDVGRDQLVDLRKPRWTLKQPCPVCGQGSALALVACPSCSWVAVQCVEEGTFFLDPKSLNAGNQGDRCPRCRVSVRRRRERAMDPTRATAKLATCAESTLALGQPAGAS